MSHEVLEIEKFSARARYYANAASREKMDVLESWDYTVFTHRNHLEAEIDFSLIQIVWDSNLEYLEKSVTSILQQTQTAELILIDNGTSGSVAKFVEMTFKRNSNVVLISVPEHRYDPTTPEFFDPTALLWNAGLFRAKGDYSFFLSCDDYLSDDYVRQVSRVFRSHTECYVVATPVTSVDSSGSTRIHQALRGSQIFEECSYVQGERIIAAILNDDPLLLAPGDLLSVRSDIALGRGGYDRLNDLSQYLKFAAGGYVGYAEQAKLFWRHHAMQTHLIWEAHGLMHYADFAGLNEQYGLDLLYDSLGMQECAHSVGEFLDRKAESVALASLTSTLRHYGVRPALLALGRLGRQASLRVVMRGVLTFLRHLPAAILSRLPKPISNRLLSLAETIRYLTTTWKRS